MFFTVDRMTPCSREFDPLPCMAVEVGAVKPAAHRKRMSVEKNLIFIHLAVGFFQTCHLLFLSLLKPAILTLGKMRQEDFQELELCTEFVVRLSQVSSPSPFTSKDLCDVFCLFLPCRLSGDAVLNSIP